MYLRSQAPTLDMSGSGSSFNGGWGPIGGSYGFGTNSQGQNTQSFGIGPSIGIKYGAGYTRSYTFTMPFEYPAPNLDIPVLPVPGLFYVPPF